MTKGKLYLIPTFLGHDEKALLPTYVETIASGLDHFIVEREKSARRFLIRIGCAHDFDEVKFYSIDKHSDVNNYWEYVQVIIEGTSMGLLSEAGAPCVGDPGALVVELAHQNDIEVIPMVGPSSLILALMASGLNGQQFAFNGYLPIQSGERKRAIKQLERNALSFRQTQIFIETPYRNNALFEDLIGSCGKDTKLCVACDLTMPSQWIKTRSIDAWKSTKPNFHKRPCVFLLGI